MGTSSPFFSLCDYCSFRKKSSILSKSAMFMQAIQNNQSSYKQLRSTSYRLNGRSQLSDINTLIMNLPSSAKEEPPTTAKVIIRTSHGQLEIELWAREAPLACRNFLQHCLDDYYKDTIFHRLIPGFMIQGGDPTGTGSGGESIYGFPFKDEFHQRLRFSRRGIVAMANAGKDSNGSQFFITFGDCDHLYKKHTIFGKVTSDTIYNLMALQDLPTDSEERPLDPPVIRGTKIILNPFEDMKSNIRKQEPIKKIDQKAAIQQQKAKDKEEMKKLKKKNRLTFDCEQVEQSDYKVKSSHDMLKDDKLSNKVAVNTQILQQKLKEKQQLQEKKREMRDRMIAGQKEELGSLLSQQLSKKRKLNQNVAVKIQDEVLNFTTQFNVDTNRHQITWQKPKTKEELERQRLEQVKQLQKKQCEGILADQLNFKKAKQGSRKQKRKMLINQQIQLLSNAERIRYEFLKKKEQQKVETSLFDKLNLFTQKLKGGGESGKNWMKHTLKFHIDSQAAYHFDEKKKLLHKDEQDFDDGGLKIQVEKTEPLHQEFNVDQLYDMIHQEQNEEQK